MKPVFADPKTDVIFKKIFGEVAHKRLLMELLNSLLELDLAHRIVDIDYLSPEQLPRRDKRKVSLVDVKCKDASGTQYVVEMQVIEVEGFQKRVVYNACKAYTNQLGVGEDYPALNDVIAVTICNFVLWPDAGEEGRPPVPMLSHWHMAERHSGRSGLPEVQYVFLELPKYTAGDEPQTTVDKWALFFRETRLLRQVPASLAQAPYAEAIEIARLANLTEYEAEVYEAEKMAQQDFRGGLSLAEKRGAEQGERIGIEKGKQLGIEQGKQLGIEQGLRSAISDLCEVLGIEIGAARASELMGMDGPGLERLRAEIKAARAWPPTERP